MNKIFLKTSIATAISLISVASFADTTFGTDVKVDQTTVTDNIKEALANPANQSVSIVNTDVNKRAVYLTGDSASIFGQEISIDGQKGKVGETIRAENASTLNLGNESTERIVLQGTGDVLNAFGKSQINIEANEVNLIAGENGTAIWLQNNTETPKLPDDGTHLTIDAENTVITAGFAGIRAFSNSKLDITGNLRIDAPVAIDTRGNSEININQDGRSTVVINGDIIFETPGSTDNSGQYVNSKVNINLSGEGSSWTGGIGKAYASYLEGKVDKEGNKYTAVNGFTLSLKDGATWNAVAADVSGFGNGYITDAAIVANNVNLDNGVINVLDNHEVKIGSMGGSGGAINLVATTDDGQSIKSGSVSIAETTSEMPVSVSLIGVTADDITNAEAAMESLNGKVTTTTKGKIAKTQRITEGDIRGEMTQTIAADGTKSAVKTAENTKLASFRGLNAVSLVAWRDEVAYTNQRIEFLRDNSHAYGAWAQVYGGESSYDDKSDLTTTTIQVGADTTIGDWIAGAAFSYMTGEADLLRGEADTDAYTLSLYAERNFDSGLFINGIARYGRLSSDAKAGNMDASYDNNAFSVGGNVGYHFTFAEQGFIEPNVGLQYAYVKGDDYKASNGVKVEQDDFDALIASLGARVGFNFPNEAGKIFARVSVNHDFLGEIDGTASKGNLAESMYLDLGGTWTTYGIGTQFNFTDNLSVWGNLDRTTGGEVSTNYMMNAGVRYVF